MLATILIHTALNISCEGRRTLMKTESYPCSRQIQQPGFEQDKSGSESTMRSNNVDCVTLPNVNQS